MSTQQSKAQGKIQPRCSDPPKIAYLLYVFPFLSETFILQEILELEHQGLALRLFSLFEPSDSKAYEAARNVQSSIIYFSRLSIIALIGAAVQRFLKAPWNFTRTSILMLSHYRRRSVLRPLFYAAYLANQVEREGITHLHAHFATASTSLGQAVHLLTGIPYSFTAHAYDIYLSPASELACKMRMARFVITCTAYNQRYLTTLVGQDVGERVYCIYHGLNFRAFPSNVPVPSVPLTFPLILTVARLVEKKGLSYLLHACRILADQGYDFTCRIVGDGPLRQILEQEIHELALIDRVELWGAEAHERVIKMYQQASIVTLPCIVDKKGDRDGIPNVLVEAMYMGIPVVSTTVSGIPELITSEINGLLVPPHDSTALAAALARLLDDPLLRCRLAVVGRQTVLEQFDMARNAIQLLHLLCTN